MYNDAANVAFSSLQRRYIFDEVEAEANLAWDQLLFKLSNKLFTAAKTNAACMQIDHGLLQYLVPRKSGKKAAVLVPDDVPTEVSRLHALHFLGRRLDINVQLATYLNQHLRTAVEYAIDAFERSGLAFAGTLAALLENTRIAHCNLSERYCLDDWDSIVREVDEEVALSCLNGRICNQMMCCINEDLLPNFRYDACEKRYVCLLPKP